MRHLIIISLFFWSAQSIAQSQLDSLNTYALELNSSNPDSARKVALLALAEAQKQKNPTAMADAYLRIGHSYLDQLEYYQALSYYEKSLKLNTKYGSEQKIAGNKIALANVLIEYNAVSIRNQNNSLLIRARKLIDEAQQICLTKKDTSLLAKSYIPLGLSYVGFNNVKSRNYYLKSYNLAQVLNDSELCTIACQNLAATFEQSNTYDSIIHWSYLAKGYNQQKSTISEIVTNINIGYAYFMKEMDDSALLYYTKAEELVEKNNFREKRLSVYKNMAYYHSIAGSPTDAIAYFDAFVELNDTLNNAEKLRFFSTAQEEFHTKELEAQTALEKKKRQQWTFLSLGFMAIGIVLAMYFYQRRKFIKQQIDKERAQFESLLEQRDNKNLQSIIDALDEDRNRISQDLHDRVGAGISTAKLYFEGMRDLIDTKNVKMEQHLELIDGLLSDAVGEIRAVSRNITSGILSDFGLIPALNDLQETIEKSGKLSVTLEADKNIKRLSKDIEIGIYRVVQELVSNTIKYANASTIAIILQLTDNAVLLSYKDDGIGFNPTKSEPGQGQKNIANRIQNLGGSMNLNSQDGVGVHYSISIPIKEK